MSLHPEPIGPVPEETIRVARAAFPKGKVSMPLRDVLGTVYDDAQFATLFATRGRPAETPWRLALVTVMPFGEGLSDRQAAEAVRARIDWKYALGFDLTDPGFDYSVLSEFRARLVRGRPHTSCSIRSSPPVRSVATSTCAAVSAPSPPMSSGHYSS